MSNVSKQKEEEKQNAVLQQAESVKKMMPDTYKKFQLIGESLITMKYNDLIVGEDWEGQPVEANELHKKINYFGLSLDDLTEEEQKLLKKYPLT